MPHLRHGLQSLVQASYATRGAVLLSTTLVPVAVCAQANALFFNFPNGNVYDGSTPVKVEVWASFEPQYFAWGGWSGDLNGEVSGSFDSLSLPIKLVPGTSPGLAEGGGVKGIVAGQLYWGALIWPNTFSPIHIWSGEWSTNDLTPRSVALGTSTQQFWVYLLNNASIPLIPAEATAQIQVVPGPAGFAIGVMFTLFRRRRR